MVEKIDKQIERETEAIRAVVQALEPLPSDVRAHVIGYVLTRLGIVLSPALQPENTRASSFAADALLVKRDATPGTAGDQGVKPAHIKDLKDLKKPRSASEMVALVAYFLANLAPQKDRKDRVTTKDIDTYFRIAEYPLPEKIVFTLPNAKAAGYVDAVGNGEYKLNAVGHNLVVHSMPRGGDSRKSTKQKPTKKNRRSRTGN